MLRSSGILLLLFTGMAEAQQPVKEHMIWSGDKPVGATWARMGEKGSLKVVKGKGRVRGTSALELRLDGEGWRGGGLNWKGWFPRDAYDDLSGYQALTFYIRQETNFADADLHLSLVDNVYRKEGKSSNELSVVGQGGVHRLDTTWRRVVLPLQGFTKGKVLRLDRLWGLDFSNNGGPNAVILIDQIAFTLEKGEQATFAEGKGYSANVKLIPGKGHRISDGIYGVAGWTPAAQKEFQIPVTRWGGNTSSRYNWKLNVDNGASDWYFKNRGKQIHRPEDTAYLQHIQENQQLGATSYITVPMLGWVARDDHSYGYSIKRYGKQRGHEPGHADVGNGIKLDGTNMTGNDPLDTSVSVGPEFIAEAVRLVVKKAGRADAKKPGVKYWVLDNEPMLWHSTHRDVRPRPLSYDELWERTIRYAEAIKKEDPSAQVAGFCSWGFLDLYYSAADEVKGDRRRADFKSHGSVPLCEWFIQKCGEYRKTHGKSLVDVLDVHWYPQATIKGIGPYLGKGMDAELNALRLRTTRDLWDPKYNQESWIRDVNAKPVALLPLLKNWIAKHNPEMQLCLGEYNFGGSDNISGGLAQAEVFGILAREAIDLAFIWHTPEGTQELGWHLFRNYNGKGGKFGNRYHSIESDHPMLSAFAARQMDTTWTIALINKNLHGSCKVKLDLPKVSGSTKVWRFDQTSKGRVVEVKDATNKINGELSLTLPAASASMIVITE